MYLADIDIHIEGGFWEILGKAIAGLFCLGVIGIILYFLLLLAIIKWG